MCNYSKQKKPKEIIFVLFMLTWGFTRLGVYPYRYCTYHCLVLCHFEFERYMYVWKYKFERPNSDSVAGSDDVLLNEIPHWDSLYLPDHLLNLINLICPFRSGFALVLLILQNFVEHHCGAISLRDGEDIFHALVLQLFPLSAHGSTCYVVV